MQHFWSSLPAEVEQPLCIGATGTLHLLAIARQSLARAEKDAGSATLARLAADALLAAWELFPFASDLARQALTLNQALNLLPEPVLGSLKAVALPHPEDSGNTALPHRLRNRMAQGDHGRARQLLQDAPSGSPFSPGLCHTLLELAWQDNAALWALEQLQRLAMATPPGLGKLLEADLLFLAGNYGEAATACAACLNTLPLPGVAARLAACHLRLGDRTGAAAWLRQTLRARPWSTSAILTLSDLEDNTPSAPRHPQGQGALLVYTWNKAAALDATLASLAASDTAGARIVILDNGSTDKTQEVVRAWAQRLGERCETLTLPVNIGAPAARNWLLSRDTVRQSQWLAYLDDDILLPADWLGNLASAMARYPEAAVYGCAVRDLGGGRLQSADLHPRPDYAVMQATEKPGSGPAPEPSDLHLQAPDLGQFDYLRPCLSVTGCCHLFRTRALLEAGGFDIRFSPSQFDDFDCDLRLTLAGGFAVYQGHLRVEHQRRTGTGLAQSTAASANARANKDKLHAKYSPRERRALREAAIARITKDLHARIRAIAASVAREPSREPAGKLVSLTGGE
jgi:GT2 family glycosyltransferase